jgi:hypothetical protein
MDKETDFGVVTFGEDGEKERRQQLLDLFRSWPITDDEFFHNLGLFLTPQTLSRILFMDHLYRQILDVQGIVIEFGCRWGQTLAVFTALRGIYEPFNRLRKIVGFDTFQGFPDVSGKDHESFRKGGYGVSQAYEEYLRAILQFQEKESPLSHLQKFEIVKGDARESILKYLEKNPETIVALAYFDMDIYDPTLKCLEAIRDRLTRGSVLGFDELNDHVCPGETQALKEVLGLGRYRIKRYPSCGRTSYLVVD